MMPRGDTFFLKDVVVSAGQFYCPFSIVKRHLWHVIVTTVPVSVLALWIIVAGFRGSSYPGRAVLCHLSILLEYLFCKPLIYIFQQFLNN